MGRRADLLFLHEMRKECVDLRRAKLRRRAAIVSDEVLCATQVFLLRRLRKPPQVQVGPSLAYGYAATWMVTREAKTDCRGSGLVQNA